MYNQESINVLIAVRSTDMSVRSRVARSVTCNLRWADNSVAGMMEEARNCLDALGPKSEVRTAGLAEMLLLSLELAKRQLDRLAIALRSDSW